MNYTSQLKGWAIDRVIELWKATDAHERLGALGLRELKEQADELAKYAYDPEGDFNDTMARMSKLIKEIPDPLEKINLLMAELSVIQEEIERQQMMANNAGKVVTMEKH
jgi:glutaredoxin 2